MEPLISTEDIKKYFDVAQGRNTAEMSRFIQEAQMFDFRNIFPDKFFNDLMKNKADVKYTELLNGKEYEFEGFTYKFEGLKAVLAHLAYANFMLKGNIKDTSFGLVNKSSTNSQPVEFSERKVWHHSYKNQADQLWQDVKKYLDRFAADYPIWKECTLTKSSSFKTRVIQ